jgi:glycosyltransferase 2 family protein
LGTVGNTTLHLLALTFVIAAFGYEFNLALGIIVMSGGVLAATASPTPGGLLGAEAGITAVLVAYGVDTPIALAIALTYRFISYWMPIVPGVAAFLYARRKRYV